MADGWLGSWCPWCGPDVGVDEDGLCTSCGTDAVGPGADRAHLYRQEAEQAELVRREVRLWRWGFLGLLLLRVNLFFWLGW